MAQIEITNITDGPVTIRDFYSTMRPGQVFKTSRSVEQLRGMTGLQEAVSNNEVTVAVILSDAEKRSGLIPEIGQ